MNSWKQLSMSSAEQKLFGEQALVLKYGEDAPKGLLPENVVSSRRYEDVEDNLLTVFNRLERDELAFRSLS